MANVLSTTFADASSDGAYDTAFRQAKHSAEANHLHIPESTHSINTDFSLIELEAALKKCNGRSVGPDAVSYNMIKHLHQETKLILLRIFNTIWNERVFPKAWTHVYVIPLLKPGKPASNPESYRPISLTSNLSKVFERMVVRRLNWWLEAEGKLDNTQNGFRSGRSVTDNAVILHRTVVEGLNRGEHSFCVFFDLKKAYDRVWRRHTYQ